MLRGNSVVEQIRRRVGIKNATCGKRVEIIEPVNLYDCKIGDDCFIGPFVEIQKDVIIGDRCRIQSHSFICELVSIGSDCVIAHGVMFINDRFQSGRPAMGDKSKWRATKIGNQVYIGSNATLLPVTVCDHTVIGAGSVVTKDITISGVYAGNPARRIGELP
jgi:acetyltransferase-like isoleucine patch superfamily enzyme